MKRVFCKYHYFSYGNGITTYAELLGIDVDIKLNEFNTTINDGKIHAHISIDADLGKGDDMTAKIRLIGGTETENAGDVIEVEFSRLDFAVSDKALLEILEEYDNEEPLAETGKEVLLYLKEKMQ